MTTIKIKDVMTRRPMMIQPTQTVQAAAQMMKDEDIGVLPVGEPQAVIGVITDRDITVRITAEGRDASKVKVQDAMTHKFITCNEDDDIEHAAELMRKHDVSRVMVSGFNTVTGIVTIADLLRNKGDRRESDKVLHHLLGRKAPQKKVCTGGTAAVIGGESCDIYDEAL
jgi:CBS domain-containing protein